MKDFIIITLLCIWALACTSAEEVIPEVQDSPEVVQPVIAIQDSTGQDTSQMSDLPKYPIMEPIRIQYGSDSLQFGDLILPYGSDRTPVIMIIHGGCWRSSYDYTLMDSMAVDLAPKRLRHLEC